MNAPLQPKTVAEVMTKQVLVVAPTTVFKTIVQIMEDNRISGLPVVDASGEVVGVVSEADLLLKEEQQILARQAWLGGEQKRAERRKAKAITAIDLMTCPALTIAPEATVSEAARRMHENRVKRLVVVDEGGRLLGIVSRADLLKVFLRSDSEIAEQVRVDLIGRTLWLDEAVVDVQVAGGVVTLTGTVPRRTDVELIGSLSERLDGVVAVRNELKFDWDDHLWEKQSLRSPISNEEQTQATGPEYRIRA